MPESIIRVSAQELTSIRFARKDGTIVEAPVSQVALDSRILGLEQTEVRDAARQLADALNRIQKEFSNARIEFLLPVKN